MIAVYVALILTKFKWLGFMQGVVWFVSTPFLLGRIVVDEIELNPNLVELCI